MERTTSLFSSVHMAWLRHFKAWFCQFLVVGEKYNFCENSTFLIIEGLCIAMRQMKLEGNSFKMMYNVRQFGEILAVFCPWVLVRTQQKSIDLDHENMENEKKGIWLKK
jgi:hypothetical protein